MNLTLTHHEFGEALGAGVARSQSAILQTILTELRHMSATQTQQQTDFAELIVDIQSLVGEIASIKTAAAANAGSVPADLQAQIDAAHASAQGVLQTATSATGAATGGTPTADAGGALPTAG